MSLFHGSWKKNHIVGKLKNLISSLQIFTIISHSYLRVTQRISRPMLTNVVGSSGISPPIVTETPSAFTDSQWCLLLTLKIDFIGCKDFSSIPTFFRIFTKKVHQDLFLGAAWEEQVATVGSGPWENCCACSLPHRSACCARRQRRLQMGNLWSLDIPTLAVERLLETLVAQFMTGEHQ